MCEIISESYLLYWCTLPNALFLLARMLYLATSHIPKSSISFCCCSIMAGKYTSSCKEFILLVAYQFLLFCLFLLTRNLYMDLFWFIRPCKKTKWTQKEQKVCTRYHVIVERFILARQVDWYIQGWRKRTSFMKG